MKPEVPFPGPEDARAPRGRTKGKRKEAFLKSILLGTGTRGSNVGEQAREGLAMCIRRMKARFIESSRPVTRSAASLLIIAGMRGSGRNMSNQRSLLVDSRIRMTLAAGIDRQAQKKSWLFLILDTHARPEKHRLPSTRGLVNSE